jgi:hypothetical protein
MSVAGGEETQVLDQGRESFWTLTDQGIYFGVVNSSLAPVIKFYTFGNGQVGIVKEFPKGTKFPMAAVGLVAGTGVGLSGRGKYRKPPLVIG